MSALRFGRDYPYAALPGRRDVLRAIGALVACASLRPASALAMPDPEIAGCVSAPGGRLWYRINGADWLASGPPPLVVLHGGPGSNHRGLVPLTALADERAIVLYDGQRRIPGDDTANPASHVIRCG